VISRWLQDGGGGCTLVVEMVCPVTVKEETVGVVGPAAFGGEME